MDVRVQFNDFLRRPDDKQPKLAAFLQTPSSFLRSAPTLPSGLHVCVHGAGGPPGSCRGLVWGVYLDGGMSGATVHGNVIGATLHGAVFDNAGGNNSITNNVFVGGAGSSVLTSSTAP